MDQEKFFRMCLEHHLWATKKWIDMLSFFQNIDRATSNILRLFDQEKLWLERCQKAPCYNGISSDLFQIARVHHDAWLELLDQYAFEEMIHYKEEGQMMQHSFLEIVHNICSYGTYYRGKLCGFALAEGIHEELLPKTSPLMYSHECQIGTLSDCTFRAELGSCQN